MGEFAFAYSGSAFGDCHNAYDTPGTNRRLAASLSFPAISVPGGFFSDGLPIGLEFLARPKAF